MLLRLKMLDKETLLIDLEGILRSLGTNVYGGGLGYIDSIIFKRVSECIEDPSDYAYRVAKSVGRPRSAVFLTATDVSEYIYVARSSGELLIEAIATVGLTHPSCIDDESMKDLNGGGTINIFLATSAELSDIGLIDLFRSVSEAKAGLIAILGLSCGGSIAVGTVSDATLVASRIGFNNYAGIGTEVGRLAASAILEILRIHMGRKRPSDYIRYMGYLESTEGEHLDAEIVIVRRVLLLLEQISRTRLVPWIGSDSVKKIYDRVRENLGVEDERGEA